VAQWGRAKLLSAAVETFPYPNPSSGSLIFVIRFDRMPNDKQRTR
jgi:hypothetical protein